MLVHGLKRRRLLQRLGGFAVPPELGVGEAEAVPGAVDLGIETRGFAKLVDRLVELPALVERETEIEVGHRVARVRAQHRLEVGFRLGETFLRRKQTGDAVCGPQKSRRGLHCRLIRGNGFLLETEQLKQATLNVISPMIPRSILCTTLSQSPSHRPTRLAF